MRSGTSSGFCCRFSEGLVHVVVPSSRVHNDDDDEDDERSASAVSACVFADDGQPLSSGKRDCRSIFGAPLASTTSAANRSSSFEKKPTKGSSSLAPGPLKATLLPGVLASRDRDGDTSLEDIKSSDEKMVSSALGEESGFVDETWNVAIHMMMVMKCIGDLAFERCMLK